VDGAAAFFFSWAAFACPYYGTVACLNHECRALDFLQSKYVEET
jgi:hypothetical protein